MLCGWRQFRRLWWAGLLAVWSLSAFYAGEAQDAGPSIPSPTATPIPQVTPQFELTGAGSCAAAGCHGGDGTRKKPDGTFNFSSSSYSVWIQRDPHARAYDVLLTDRSRNMIRQLGTGWHAAHQESRCLVCHSPLEPTVANVDHTVPVHLTQREVLHDGVSCEACHGPAEKWLVPHTEHTWRDRMTADSRAALGFVDLRFDLVRRSQTCVKCHVGGPGRDVNHDLIAAGHPRLNFELSAYHANMPAHWDGEADRRNFPAQDDARGSIREAKLWVLGQLTTADAALNLLAVRAQATQESDTANGTAAKTAWPEFAEYGCFACHHDLQSPSWRQQSPVPGRKPGSYPWGTWNFPLTTVLESSDSPGPLAKALQQLEQTMGRPSPVVGEVLPQVQFARELIATELVKHTTPASLTAERIRQLLERVTHDGQQLSSRDWDAAAQVYLGTVALYQARLEAEGQGLRLQVPEPADQELLAALETLREKLKFPQPPEAPSQFTSPRTFDSQRIEIIHDQLRKLEELVKRP
ncbi:MAG: multiheme c-type cytochrome [Planctomycetota bacterium]